MKLSSCSALHYLFLGSEAFQNNVSAELLIKGAKPFGLCVRHAGNPLVIYNCLPFSWEGITADPQMHTIGLIMVIFIFAHEYFISKTRVMMHHWTPVYKPPCHSLPTLKHSTCMTIQVQRQFHFPMLWFRINTVGCSFLPCYLLFTISSGFQCAFGSLLEERKPRVWVYPSHTFTLSSSLLRVPMWSLSIISSTSSGPNSSCGYVISDVTLSCSWLNVGFGRRSLADIVLPIVGNGIENDSLPVSDSALETKNNRNGQVRRDLKPCV